MTINLILFVLVWLVPTLKCFHFCRAVCFKSAVVSENSPFFQAHCLCLLVRLLNLCYSMFSVVWIVALSHQPCSTAECHLLCRCINDCLISSIQAFVTWYQNSDPLCSVFKRVLDAANHSGIHSALHHSTALQDWWSETAAAQKIVCKSSHIPFRL